MAVLWFTNQVVESHVLAKCGYSPVPALEQQKLCFSPVSGSWESSFQKIDIHYRERGWACDCR
jgi:hypothetical protein